MLYKLSEIASVIMGQSPKSSSYNSDMLGLPFLQGGTTFGDKYPYFDIWTTEWNKEANPNDILFTVRAPVGDLNIANTKIAIGRGIAAIRPKKVTTLYLYYLLQTNKHIFLTSSVGTIFDSINKDALESVYLDIHKEQDQHHIVNTIGSVDNLIENYQSQIEKIIKIGDHLLITDSNKKSIIEYVDVLLGGTPSRKHLEYWNGDIKWINSGAITGTPAILKESDFITIDGVKHSATKSANKGDTVLSIIEPSKSKVALILDDNVYFNQSVICFSSKNKLDKGFIFFASRSLIEEIKGYATGAAQQSLNKEMIEKSKIHVPNQKTKIKLNNFFYSIISLEEKIRKLTILKEMLLLKYF
ncbi:restriction endonuclease subunit S [Metamycoplasma hyosynoviae]|uniref:restriction endonuclease subunit S n=1 Tax=Metamycoplasma hyosynoviae TaxID=29559 RepID=UPI00235F86A2|nr:restriction endonuclease subunit S [Metamycoplasma hyosynoviae]MDD1378553.1 restriction endonuclease subunit S [Metamycoplasma hyosynoviae]